MQHHSYRFAIIVSEFNKEVTKKLLDGALFFLKENQVSEKDTRVIKVPGAIEIPLIAKLLSQTKSYNAIICLGAVIRGDTDHYDYVCQQVSQGCMQVMLQYDIPIIFGVLTTNNVEQALDRVGGKEGHKGIDAANTALAMARIIRELKHGPNI